MLRHKLTLNRYCSSISDSSLVTPWMRRVKPLLTKTPFHPVTANSSQRLLKSSEIHGIHTVRSDHWVDCFQRRAVVQWRSTRNCSQWVAQSLGFFVEELCIVYGGESFQVGGHGRRQAVVNLIHRCPELVVVSIESCCCKPSNNILTVSPPVFGSVWIFNIA